MTARQCWVPQVGALKRGLGEAAALNILLALFQFACNESTIPVFCDAGALPVLQSILNTPSRVRCATHQAAPPSCADYFDGKYTRGSSANSKHS